MTARRGRKPKAPNLRLVDGSHRQDRHGDAKAITEAVANSAAMFGPLERPKHLKGVGLAAWRKYIEPANWLDASREPAAIAFCELWQELRRAPIAFNSAKHAQMRGYLSDLGLTDERRRAAQTAASSDRH